MYIPEFWCGVGATLLTELIGVIAYAVWQNRKNQ